MCIYKLVGLHAGIRTFSGTGTKLGNRPSLRLATIIALSWALPLQSVLSADTAEHDSVLFRFCYSKWFSGMLLAVATVDRFEPDLLDVC